MSIPVCFMPSVQTGDTLACRNWKTLGAPRSSESVGRARVDVATFPQRFRGRIDGFPARHPMTLEERA